MESILHTISPFALLCRYLIRSHFQALKYMSPYGAPLNWNPKTQNITSTVKSLFQLLAHSNTLEELSRLPIRMNTVRVRNLRGELESRLSELESAINIFTKPVVYVKLD